MVTIFQRPAGLSLKVPEDVQEDNFPMEDAELEVIQLYFLFFIVF